MPEPSPQPAPAPKRPPLRHAMRTLPRFVQKPALEQDSSLRGSAGAANLSEIVDLSNGDPVELERTRAQLDRNVCVKAHRELALQEECRRFNRLQATPARAAAPPARNAQRSGHSECCRTTRTSVRTARVPSGSRLRGVSYAGSHRGHPIDWTNTWSAPRSSALTNANERTRPRTKSLPKYRHHRC